MSERVQQDSQQNPTQATIDQRLADWGEISDLFQLVSGNELAVVAFGAMSRYIRLESDLSARMRELVVLRTAFLMGLNYCVGRHLPIARAAGIDADEINVLGEADRPVVAASFTEVEREVLDAVDVLASGSVLAPAQLRALDAALQRSGVVDLILTVGWYRLIGCVINGFQLEVPAQ